MTGPVLVGVDPDALNSSAFVWAVEWCLHTGDELLIVSAFIPAQAEMPPQWHDEAIAEAHRAVEARLGSIEGRGPLHRRSRMVDGEASDVVVETAREEDASLVVLGARGTGGLHELGLGGVSHHVIHHLHRPVVVVPAFGGPLQGGTIVVGVDGSAGSAAALRWAIATAARLGGSVQIVHGYGRTADLSSETDQRKGIEGEAELRAHIEMIHTHGVPVTTTFVDSHPVAALTEAGAQHQASLIVVGTRGRGGFDGLLLGRVPAQLPHHARRPVVIIHHDHRH